ncbi:MAG: hypothetical protein Kow0098_19620 [Ignavibacteriaceae bacterium]
MGQRFTKITDKANQVVSAQSDYNPDRNEDLFVTKDFLFKGDITGSFEFIPALFCENIAG